MKRVLVFGASRGIGRATALAFGGQGAVVGLAARDAVALEQVATEIRALGGRALVLPADVADRAAVERAVAEVELNVGGIDVLVNTAGVNTAQRRLDVLPLAEWERLLAINLTGAFNTLQAVLPRMRQRGDGLVIQIASVAGRWPDQTGVTYQASKAGLISLCQAAQLEVHPDGVRISAILPGLVDTPLVRNRPNPRPFEQLDRALRPEDVAGACLFLASLPARVYLPELIILPGGLQTIGQTTI